MADADLTAPAVTSEAGPLDALPPGPVADLLAEAMSHVPDRPERVVALAQKALSLSAGDTLAEALAQTFLGFGLYLRSEHDAAAEVLTRALAAIEPLGDLSARSMALGALASVHVSQGHYDEALELALENLRVSRALGDTEGEAWILATMGNAYLDLDQPEAALRHGDDALRMFAQIGSTSGQARAHTVLGGALRVLGRLDEAQAHHEAALRIAREQGIALTEARALDDLGQCARCRGDYQDALALHREALQLRGQAGNRQAQATSLIAIGRTLTDMGRPSDALPALREALGIAEEVGAEPRQAQAHEALAEALGASEDPEGALHHYRLYHALQEDLLSAQARSRIHTIEVRAEADAARRDAEMARMRTDELGALNSELQTALDELRSTQGQLVQAEKLASLGRLSAGLAHEIQNPLNFVGNFAELNAELAADLLKTVREARTGHRPPNLDDVESDLDAIVSNASRVRDHARRAGGIVDGLMGHVRDVGGDRRPADLHELIERAVSTSLRGADLRVERTYEQEMPPVEVVARSIQRVFVNLLENARWSVEQHADVAPEGWSPAVQLATRSVEGAVEVRVVDNGVGIKLADCTRVFEPFFTTKPAGTGTGLGLSLAYDIVTEGHGGTLAAYSREGQGATFVVTLPAG